MEILSDATFKGNVSVKGETNVGVLRLTADNGYSYSYITTSEFSLIEGRIEAHPSSLCLRLPLDVGGHDISACVLRTNYIGTFETTQDNPIIIHSNNSGESYNFNKPYCINVVFSANNSNGLSICMCTKHVYIPIKEGTVAFTSDIPSLSDYQKKFTTFSSPSVPANCTAFEFTGTAISDSNKTHLIQVQNTSTGKSVIAETWMTTNKKPAMSFAGCTSTVAAGTYTAIVL